MIKIKNIILKYHIKISNQIKSSTFIPFAPQGKTNKKIKEL